MPDEQTKNEGRGTSDDIESRPYPNEHACRLRDPGDFKKDSIRSTDRKHDGKVYRVLMGKLKNPPKGKEGSMVEQAYRYNKETWTASDAKSHCDEHDGKFEAAKDSKSSQSVNIERRILCFDDTEIRAEDGEKPRLVGYAAKYNKFTELNTFMGPIKEKIHPDFFNDVLNDDVRCEKNHDPNLILGRTTNGTLRIKSNTIGLHYENDLPNTNTGRDVYEEVRTKLITGCSFSFIVAEGGEKWEFYNDDRPTERTLLKCEKLFDVGPVTYPAYPDTNVAARSMERAKQEGRDTDSAGDNQRAEIPAVSKDETDRADKKYECECIECGHTLKTDKHCKDIKCSECGGTMRRKERPGPGQKTKDEGGETKDEGGETKDEGGETSDELTFDQKFEYEQNVRKAERLRNRLNQNKQAEA